MKKYKFEDLHSGWYIGDFWPTVKKWDKGEMAVKHFPKGHIEMSYVHDDAMVYYVVLTGRIKFGNYEVSENDVIEILPGENLPMVVIENSVVLLTVIGKTKATRMRVESLAHVENTLGQIYKFREYSGNIDFKDISVVVQGAIDKDVTAICLKSIRKYLPGAVIILSTWENSNVSNLDFDIVIFNKDPGGYEYKQTMSERVFVNNVNRQLLSIQNGLKVVDTQYVLKIRTDMILVSNSFLNYFNEYGIREEDSKLFEHKIIIADFYTRHSLRCAKKYIPTPFHISDWLFFGLLEDINLYFRDTRLMSFEEATDFKDVKRPEVRDEYGYFWKWKFPPEQFFANEVVAKYYPKFKMHDWSDWNADIVRFSNLFIVNNFIVLDFDKHGIYMPKYDMVWTSSTGKRKYFERGLVKSEIYEELYYGGYENIENYNGWDDVITDNNWYWMYKYEK